MILFENYKAILFDMDGLLLDSERPFVQAFEKACMDFDLEYDASLILKTYGTNKETTLRIFSKHFEDEHLSKRLLEHTFIRFNELIVKTPLELMQGARELLENIYLKNIPIGLATSTHEALAISHLEKANILNYFDEMMTGDKVSNGKPNPEIYLKAAQKLGVAPSACLAFEDSDNGVRSAYAAGMTVVQVPHLVAPCEEVKAFNHLILGSLTEVIAE